MIGGDCDDIADKFEDDIHAIFTENSRQMKAREIPVHQRKYILSKSNTLPNTCHLYRVCGVAQSWLSDFWVPREEDMFETRSQPLII